MDHNLKIESTKNPRVKTVNRLRKSKHRTELKQTVVEGCREIQRAFESGWPFLELYICPELYLAVDEDLLVEKIQHSGVPVFQCSEAAFRKMSYRDTPDGLMALSPLVGKSLAELKLPENPLILIAEDLEKPGNLGTILRTADATGVDAVIACDHKTDLNNPNVIRASIGTLFFMPVAEATSDEVFEWLKKNGIQSLAAVPDAETEYTGIDMNGGTAVVVGAEDEGLTDQWIKGADHAVSIPMLGKNDSLNVSTAAAILLYEAVRQRRKHL
ncbi:TrmH family RNA methyltransferase [Pontiella agarivorans]|uniref:RNA methyltransferase n=1 Tax=Pontiella agarivorans TaxID=3038953 RepID=A0ABU5MV74_9BACT|nr:RNA methyltransferase [Pontiella agarivorans]MDZ8117851.1 RNA methyltransferase [Pontiella agarivorans]